MSNLFMCIVILQYLEGALMLLLNQSLVIKGLEYYTSITG